MTYVLVVLFFAVMLWLMYLGGSGDRIALISSLSMASCILLLLGVSYIEDKRKRYKCEQYLPRAVNCVLAYVPDKKL